MSIVIHKAYQKGPFERLLSTANDVLRKCIKWNFKGIRTFEVGMAFLVKGDDPVLPI